jgi:peroxiredoxin
MSEIVHTIEGWYALHDFRKFNWQAWKNTSIEEKKQVEQELFTFFDLWQKNESSSNGSTAIYSILGQKADFVILYLRESLEEIEQIELQMNKSKFASYTIPSYSYVSVVELSGYLAKPGIQPEDDPELKARLFPIMPKSKHICFYPMNKRRTGSDNWYMLPSEERKKFMRSHGLIGRQYAGKIKQIITGSIGLDNWEWGVTLFADDALQFKKIVHEMRFDEASARFAEFGDFYVGNLLTLQKMNEILMN